MIPFFRQVLVGFILVGSVLFAKVEGSTSLGHNEVSTVPSLETSSSAALTISQSAPNADALNASPQKPPNTIIISQKTAVLAGMALAFNSGFMNGCCLSGCIVNLKQASTAVTGAWTISALGAASGDMEQFTTQLRMIVSYIFGSCVSSLINPRPIPFQIQVVPCAMTFYIGSGLLFLSSRMANKDTIPSAKLCFNLAAIASGMQNSLTSVHTSNLVRSAHFSGISSDIGTFLGQAIRGNVENLFKLKVFAMLGLSFWLGGYISFIITERMASKSLLLSALFFLVIGTTTMFWKAI